LPFASKRTGVAIDKMTVTDLSPSVVRQFLDYLERERRCTGVTRNQRLGTIHSLARFIGMRSPVHLSWCTEVRLVPFKKTDKTLITYLEKPEMDALLRQPDRHTVLGLRDYCLLLFLYNSGARADEAARLTIDHLRLDDPPSVRIRGKGNKIRMCPLWPMMMPLLEKLINGRGTDQVVFLGRANKPMTRFGIHRLVTHYAEMASDEMPPIQAKRVSPHNIRHTTAVHMLRSGVDINTIRAWLGHVSLDTTNIYAEVDLEMKAKALASVDVSGQPAEPLRQRDLPSLMTFLRGI
jgi:integrase/recombinase XerD